MRRFILICIYINFIALTSGAENPNHLFQHPLSKSHISGFSSEKTLPTQFRIPYPKMIKSLPIELDKLKFPENRNHQFFAQWRPHELEKNGYIIIQGSRFLSYKTEDFIKSYNKGVYDVSSHPSHDFTSQQLILGRFWDDRIGSASLIRPSMLHVANSYGYVLSVPAELILNLYPQDVATTMERELPGNSIEDIQSNIIDHRYLPRPDKLMKNPTKYTNGYFPNPTDFLNDTEVGHNEIKFALRGQSDDKIYAVSVVGFYIKDIHDSSNTPLATSEQKQEIEGLAKELGLPVFYLSKMAEPNVAAQKHGSNDSEETIEQDIDISEKQPNHRQVFEKLETSSNVSRYAPLDGKSLALHLTSPGTSELLTSNLHLLLSDLGGGCPDSQTLVRHLASLETSKLLSDNLHFLPMKKHDFRISPAINLTQRTEKKKNGTYKSIYSVGGHEVFIIDGESIDRQ